MGGPVKSDRRKRFRQTDKPAKKTAKKATSERSEGKQGKR